MKFLCAAFLALAGFTANCWDPCKNRPKQDKIQTNSLTLLEDSNTNTCYSLNVQYDIPPSGIQIAVTTKNMDSFILEQQIDYSIRANRKDDTKSINIYFLNKKPGWKKVDIAYMLSSRDDIRLGSSMFDVFSLFQCGQKYQGQKKANLKFNLQKWPKNQNNYGVATFLSGLKSKTSNLKVRFEDASVTSDGITFKLVANSDNKIIDTYVSYILWKKSSTFQIIPILPNVISELADYTITGIQGFDNKKQLFFGLSFNSERLSCVGKGCVDSCTTASLCNGKIFKGKCVLCGNDQIQSQSGQCRQKSLKYQIKTQIKADCPFGQFKKQNNQCQNCSEYCSQCKSSQKCDVCAPGFQPIPFEQQSYCKQICGDGVIHIDQCDDSNAQDKDGCSSICTIQKGYDCQVYDKKSDCKKISFSRQTCNLNKKGALMNQGVVTQAYVLQNIPSKFLEDNCKNCAKLFDIKMIQCLIVPGIRTQYVKGSNPARFLINFDFGRVQSPPPFSYKIKLHPDLSKQFSEQQMKQQQVNEVDPGTLIKRKKNISYGLEWDQLMKFQSGLSEEQLEFLFDDF